MPAPWISASAHHRYEFQSRPPGRAAHRPRQFRDGFRQSLPARCGPGSAGRGGPDETIPALRLLPARQQASRQVRQALPRHPHARQTHQWYGRCHAIHVVPSRHGACLLQRYAGLPAHRQGTPGQFRTSPHPARRGPDCALPPTAGSAGWTAASLTDPH